MKRSQLAINTVSLRGEFTEILDGVAEAGFSQIEFHLGPLKDFLAGSDVQTVRRLLQERGLTCVGGFEGAIEAFADEETRSANHAILAENARLLSSLGAGTTQNLIVGTNSQSISEVENPIEGFAQAVAKVAAEFLPLNAHLLLEFNWGVVKTLPLAAEIVRCSGAVNAGVLFDPAHYHCTPTKMADLTPENVATIKHVHVNNMRRKPAELSNCNSDRLLPNDPDGILDLPALFGVLANGGYAGLYSIEMFSDELWSLKPRQAAQKMFESLLVFCE